MRPARLAGWTWPHPSLFSDPQNLAEETLAILGQALNVGKDHSHLRNLQKMRAETCVSVFTPKYRHGRPPIRNGK